MSYFKAISLLFILGVALSSCRKEFSTETGGVTGGGTTPNQDCKIQKLVETAKGSSKAEYAYVMTFDANKNATRIEWVDSSSNAIDNAFSVSYPAGRIQVDANQYFLKGTDGKITEFYGYRDPLDPTSDRYKVKYTYNSTGQLVKRTEEYDSLPGIIVLQVDYTYSGSNLTRAESKVTLGPSSQRLSLTTFEYDAGKTIKNFLLLYPMSSELAVFQSALNIGASATNPVTKTTSTYTDVFTGGGDTTFVTNFVNYSIDANKYVQSFEVTGDGYFEGNLYSGYRYNLVYSCF